MKQPNTQRLRALRLSALARDNKVVNAIRSSITQAPDALVKELMEFMGGLRMKLSVQFSSFGKMSSMTRRNRYWREAIVHGGQDLVG